MTDLLLLFTILIILSYLVTIALMVKMTKRLRIERDYYRGLNENLKWRIHDLQEIINRFVKQ